MIVIFSKEELEMLKELRDSNNLPPIPTEWDSETAELYRDAANDFEVLMGLDINYNLTPKGKIAIMISDKLFEVP